MRLGYCWQWSTALLFASSWAAAQTTTSVENTRTQTAPDPPASDIVSEPSPAVGPGDPVSGDAIAESPATDGVDVEPAPEPATVAPPTAAPAFRKAESPAPVLTPFAGDSLGGQFQVGVSGMFSVPFGEVSPGVDVFPKTDVGFGPAADVAFGIARHFMVGAYGELAIHGAASECRDCSSQSWGVGGFVRYHLVQGLRFDPWVSYGIGYRGLSTSSPAEGNAEYGGLEWLRLQFGGDWYATRQFGFGPFLELGAASFLSRPATEETGGVNWRFQSGLRILLDLPGR